MSLETRIYWAGGVECRVSYLVKGTSVPPILFLHGYSFTGDTWSEAGIINAVVKEGIDVAAPDMPYGKKTECSKHSRSIELNLQAIRAVVESILGGREPFIVGASLGGRVALYYAVGRELPGLLLASPALREDDPIWSRVRHVRAPALIIRGQRDFVPRKIHEKLSRKLNAPLLVYEGAGHAMYLDQPERFTRDLLDFYRRATSRKQPEGTLGRP